MPAVYVHLAHGFDARSWEERWKNGRLIGINEPTPYGYHRAREHGFDVTFSRDADENVVSRAARLGLRLVLGFDLVHAWRNRAGILGSDVVWTHTESNHLGVLMVLRLRRRTSRPKVLAQSVWLFDRWGALPQPHRLLYRWLVRRADVLTTHSPENAAVARQLFPDTRVDVVPFGIRADDVTPVDVRDTQDEIRVLGVGNDRHRDWETLVRAVRSIGTARCRIVSGTYRCTAEAARENVSVTTVTDNDELLDLYTWADVVVVPLRRNLHASGITVVQESVLRGVPVIATDTGGLRAYFDGDAVTYVEPHDADGLRTAITALAADPGRRQKMAEVAQAAMGADGLSSDSFVRRHCQLSDEMLARPTDPVQPTQ